MLLHEFLTNSARIYPEKTAVVYKNQRLSYSHLGRLSDMLCSVLLNQGISRGDRIIISMDNSFEYIVSYFAILKAGAVIVALNTQLVEREVKELLGDCTPKLVITTPKYEKIFKNNNLNTSIHTIDIVPNLKKENLFSLLFNGNEIFQAIEDPSTGGKIGEYDLASIIYTSGTTGKPKGVMLTHKNLVSNACSIVEYLGLTHSDSTMVILPFYYSYGNSLLTTNIKVGATIYLYNSFVYPNVVLDLMEKEEISVFAGVPSHYAILLRKSMLRAYKLPKLRFVTQAGGPMPPAMIKEFVDMFPHVKFYVMYGQTEATARLTYLGSEYLFTKMGSIGKAIPGVEIDVLSESLEKVQPDEIGEIVARGENIMMGYWHSPEESQKVLRKEGLFTGDLAKVDQDGFIYLVSRKKDMIKSGANRISPREIEDVVCRIPGIVECAAVGIQDEVLGELIKLYVVLAEDVNIEEKSIMIFCKENLASYKVPQKIELIRSLPKTASGKIKREELKSLKEEYRSRYETL